MIAPAGKATFLTANPHALATILEASQTKSIIASSDIFNISGTKLWARDQPVSAALQRKLLDRQLRNPIESCLLAEDGITAQTLVQCTEALVEGSAPISLLLRAHAAKIVKEAAFLPLHSVVSLLLTSGQASRPEAFDHAVQAMALAGALMISHGGSTAEVRVAMLIGLLAVTEATLAALRGERPDLARVSIALCVVPGEYDLSWVGHMAAAARTRPALQAQLDNREVQARLARLDAALDGAHGAVSTMADRAPSPALRDALDLAQHLVGRLRAGWYATGLWNSEALQGTEAAEVESIEDELFFRLRSIERATRLRAGELAEGEAAQLNQLCQGLDTGQ